MRITAPLAALLLLGGCVAARSDTLLLASGGQLEVASVSFTDEGVEVALPGGGTLRIPLDAVEGVVPSPPEPPTASGGCQEDVLAGLIREIADRYGVEPGLVRAVIQVESAFDPEAVSPKGAVGLMQLLPETARDYGVTELRDPRRNLEAGVQHLGRLTQRFGGDLDLILAAYNAGEGRVERAGGKVPSIRETRDYVKRVKRALRRGGES